MIVKNEEQNLTNCLNSAKNLVDEMIVVDTGSTDKTKEIATNLGAKVYDYAWQDNFADARNYALQFVSRDWVLILDADEVLIEKIIPHIETVIQDKNNLVVNLIRHEIGALSSPYSSISRLFRCHPEIKFSRPYHALIDDSVIKLHQKESHWQIVDLPEIAIEHYGYQPQVIISQDKTQRAKKAMESYLAENPNDAYVCSKLGSLYIDMGQFKKGLNLLKTGLKSNTGTPTTAFELHYHLANAYVKGQQYILAVKHYQRAIAQPILEKLKLGAYHNYGSLCYQQKDFQNAIGLYQNCLQIEPTFALVYYNLGLAYKAIGRIAEAIEAYQNSIKFNPNYPWAYQNLAVLQYKQNNMEKSIKLFQQAYNLHQEQNPTVAQQLKDELTAMGLELSNK
jgi:tetratricopeptide (TPR) repeat protein